MTIFDGPEEVARDINATLAAMKRAAGVTVWPKPRRHPDGPWEVKVTGDVDALPMASLVNFYREAEMAKSVTWAYEGSVRTIIYRYVNEVEAAGAISRLEKVLGD